eukprot:TRINITY_DN234_c1_g1_i5.p1 TRINITY_DN234_c1_g1~~TRINITY_DN234_c1_g1_i5.p1  ORF type:complete len:3445 (-),score=1195.40 TRINITY_DN234_c1_g1_i5:40-10374(-)
MSTASSMPASMMGSELPSALMSAMMTPRLGEGDEGEAGGLGVNEDMVRDVDDVIREEDDEEGDLDSVDREFGLGVDDEGNDSILLTTPRVIVSHSEESPEKELVPPSSSSALMQRPPPKDRKKFVPKHLMASRIQKAYRNYQLQKYFAQALAEEEAMFARQEAEMEEGLDFLDRQKEKEREEDERKLKLSRQRRQKGAVDVIEKYWRARSYFVRRRNARFAAAIAIQKMIRRVHAMKKIKKRLAEKERKRMQEDAKARKQEELIRDLREAEEEDVITVSPEASEAENGASDGEETTLMDVEDRLSEEEDMDVEDESKKKEKSSKYWWDRLPDEQREDVAASLIQNVYRRKQKEKLDQEWEELQNLEEQMRAREMEDESEFDSMMKEREKKEEAENQKSLQVSKLRRQDTAARRIQGPWKRKKDLIIWRGERLRAIVRIQRFFRQRQAFKHFRMQREKRQREESRLEEEMSARRKKMMEIMEESESVDRDVEEEREKERKEEEEKEEEEESRKNLAIEEEAASSDLDVSPLPENPDEQGDSQHTFPVEDELDASKSDAESMEIDEEKESVEKESMEEELVFESPSPSNTPQSPMSKPGEEEELDMSEDEDESILPIAEQEGENEETGGDADDKMDSEEEQEHVSQTLTNAEKEEPTSQLLSTAEDGDEMTNFDISDSEFEARDVLDSQKEDGSSDHGDEYKEDMEEVTPLEFAEERGKSPFDAEIDQSLDEEALEAVTQAKDREHEDNLPQMRVSESPVIGEGSETLDDVTEDQDVEIDDEDALKNEDQVPSQRKQPAEDHDELTITSHLDDADESEIRTLEGDSVFDMTFSDVSDDETEEKSVHKDASRYDEDDNESLLAPHAQDRHGGEDMDSTVNFEYASHAPTITDQVALREAETWKERVMKSVRHGGEHEMKLAKWEEQLKEEERQLKSKEIELQEKETFLRRKELEFESQKDALESDAASLSPEKSSYDSSVRSQTNVSDAFWRMEEERKSREKEHLRAQKDKIQSKATDHAQQRREEELERKRLELQRQSEDLKEMKEAISGQVADVDRLRQEFLKQKRLLKKKEERQMLEQKKEMEHQQVLQRVALRMEAERMMRRMLVHQSFKDRDEEDGEKTTEKKKKTNTKKRTKKKPSAPPSSASTVRDDKAQSVFMRREVDPDEKQQKEPEMERETTTVKSRRQRAKRMSSKTAKAREKKEEAAGVPTSPAQNEGDVVDKLHREERKRLEGIERSRVSRAQQRIEAERKEREEMRRLKAEMEERLKQQWESRHVHAKESARKRTPKKNESTKKRRDSHMIEWTRQKELGSGLLVESKRDLGLSVTFDESTIMEPMDKSSSAFQRPPLQRMFSERQTRRPSVIGDSLSPGQRTVEIAGLVLDPDRDIPTRSKFEWIQKVVEPHSDNAEDFDDDLELVTEEGETFLPPEHSHDHVEGDGEIAQRLRELFLQQAELISVDVNPPKTQIEEEWAGVEISPSTSFRIEKIEINPSLNFPPKSGKDVIQETRMRGEPEPSSSSKKGPKVMDTVTKTAKRLVMDLVDLATSIGDSIQNNKQTQRMFEERPVIRSVACLSSLHIQDVDDSFSRIRAPPLVCTARMFGRAVIATETISLIDFATRESRVLHFPLCLRQSPVVGLAVDVVRPLVYAVSQDGWISVWNIALSVLVHSMCITSHRSFIGTRIASPSLRVLHFVEEIDRLLLLAPHPEPKLMIMDPAFQYPLEEIDLSVVVLGLKIVAFHPFVLQLRGQKRLYALMSLEDMSHVHILDLQDPSNVQNIGCLKTCMQAPSTIAIQKGDAIIIDHIESHYLVKMFHLKPIVMQRFQELQEQGKTGILEEHMILHKDASPVVDIGFMEATNMIGVLFQDARFFAFDPEAHPTLLTEPVRRPFLRKAPGIYESMDVVFSKTNRPYWKCLQSRLSSMASPRCFGIMSFGIGDRLELVGTIEEKGMKEFRIRTMGLCSVQVRIPARRFDSKLSSKTMGKCLEEARKKSGVAFDEHISKLLTSRNKEGKVQHEMMMSNLGDARVAMRELHVNRGEISGGMESISWDVLFQTCLKFYESYHGLVVRPKTLSLASFYSILRWNQMLTEVVINPKDFVEFCQDVPRIDVGTEEVSLKPKNVLDISFDHFKTTIWQLDPLHKARKNTLNILSAFDKIARRMKPDASDPSKRVFLEATLRSMRDSIWLCSSQVLDIASSLENARLNSIVERTPSHVDVVMEEDDMEGRTKSLTELRDWDVDESTLITSISTDRDPVYACRTRLTNGRIREAMAITLSGSQSAVEFQLAAWGALSGHAPFMDVIGYIQSATTRQSSSKSPTLPYKFYIVVDGLQHCNSMRSILREHGCFYRTEEDIATLIIWFRQILEGLVLMEKESVCVDRLTLDHIYVTPSGKDVVIAMLPSCCRDGTVYTEPERLARRFLKTDDPYLPPESCDFHVPQRTTKVNSWCFGYMLYEMLSGTSPRPFADILKEFRQFHPDQMRDESTTFIPSLHYDIFKPKRGIRGNEFVDGMTPAELEQVCDLWSRLTCQPLRDSDFDLDQANIADWVRASTCSCTLRRCTAQELWNTGLFELQGPCSTEKSIQKRSLEEHMKRLLEERSPDACIKHEIVPVVEKLVSWSLLVSESDAMCDGLACDSAHEDGLPNSFNAAGLEKVLLWMRKFFFCGDEVKGAALLVRGDDVSTYAREHREQFVEKIIRSDALDMVVFLVLSAMHGSEVSSLMALSKQFFEDVIQELHSPVSLLDIHIERVLRALVKLYCGRCVLGDELFYWMPPERVNESYFSVDTKLAFGATLEKIFRLESRSIAHDYRIVREYFRVIDREGKHMAIKERWNTRMSKYFFDLLDCGENLGYLRQVTSRRQRRSGLVFLQGMVRKAESQPSLLEVICDFNVPNVVADLLTDPDEDVRNETILLFLRILNLRKSMSLSGGSAARNRSLSVHLDVIFRQVACHSVMAGLSRALSDKCQRNQWNALSVAHGVLSIADEDMVRSAGHFRMFRYLFAHLRHEKQSGVATGAAELIQSVFDEGKPVVLQEIHNQTGLLTAFEQRGIRTTMPFQFGDLQQLAEDVRGFFDFDENSTTVAFTLFHQLKSFVENHSFVLSSESIDLKDPKILSPLLEACEIAFSRVWNIAIEGKTTIIEELMELLNEFFRLCGTVLMAEKNGTGFLEALISSGIVRLMVVLYQTAIPSTPFRSNPMHQVHLSLQAFLLNCIQSEASIVHEELVKCDFVNAFCMHTQNLGDIFHQCKSQEKVEIHVMDFFGTWVSIRWQMLRGILHLPSDYYSNQLSKTGFITHLLTRAMTYEMPFMIEHRSVPESFHPHNRSIAIRVDAIRLISLIIHSRTYAKMAFSKLVSELKAHAIVQRERALAQSDSPMMTETSHAFLSLLASSGDGDLKDLVGPDFLYRNAKRVLDTSAYLGANLSLARGDAVVLQNLLRQSVSFSKSFIQ